MQGHIDAICCIAVTFDNKYVISAARDKTVRFWNLLQNKQIHVLDNFHEEVSSIEINTEYHVRISFSDNSVQEIHLENILM